MPPNLSGILSLWGPPFPAGRLRERPRVGGLGRGAELKHPKGASGPAPPPAQPGGVRGRKGVGRLGPERITSRPKSVQAPFSLTYFGRSRPSTPLRLSAGVLRSASQRPQRSA